MLADKSNWHYKLLYQLSVDECNRRREGDNLPTQLPSSLKN